MHLQRGHGLGRPKFINVNISDVYEVICMKLCNIIPLGVKSHLKGRRTLLIAPKRGFGLCVLRLQMAIAEEFTDRLARHFAVSFLLLQVIHRR